MRNAPAAVAVTMPVFESFANTVTRVRSRAWKPVPRTANGFACTMRSAGELRVSDASAALTATAKKTATNAITRLMLVLGPARADAEPPVRDGGYQAGFRSAPVYVVSRVCEPP